MRKIILSILLVSLVLAGNKFNIPTKPECKYLLENSIKYYNKAQEKSGTIKTRYINLSNNYYNQHNSCMKGTSQRVYGDKLPF